jgi:hypothetical protein
MRINVYAEELTDEVEVVTKAVSDAKFGDRTFYGIRLWLASPPELHNDPEDDDRSAITFWIPWTRAGGHNIGWAKGLFGPAGAIAAAFGQIERSIFANGESYT